ncbi:MAG TPA: hypothetical protein VF519_01450 [Mycobacteriales bacterium]
MNTSTTWTQRAERLSRRVGAATVVWFGTRGEDGLPLLPLTGDGGTFEAHSITAPVAGRRVLGASLEGLANRRVDLDTYDLDTDDRDVVAELRRALLVTARRPVILVPYRSSEFIAAIQFANFATVSLLAMFHERQAAFDHKPWVESTLRAAGVDVIPWRYVAFEDRAAVRREVERGPVMLRASRTSGGVGLGLVVDPDDLDAVWPQRRDSYAAVAPYFADAVPVNTAGVVFPDGSVTSAPISVQLIGVPECTTRPFGYCGNDFAAGAALSATALDGIDTVVRRVGEWLAQERYIGTFGVDLLVDGNRVLFTELNPRFQGSSALAADIARKCDVPDVYLDHCAAHLGLPAGSYVPLREWAATQDHVSQLICHNLTDGPVARRGLDMALPADGRVELVPPPNVEVDAGAALARVVLSRQVTTTGLALHDEAARVAVAITASFARTASGLAAPVMSQKEMLHV